jgi:hypothetical protein
MAQLGATLSSRGPCTRGAPQRTASRCKKRASLSMHNIAVNKRIARISVQHLGAYRCKTCRSTSVSG